MRAAGNAGVRSLSEPSEPSAGIGPAAGRSCVLCRRFGEAVESLAGSCVPARACRHPTCAAAVVDRVHHSSARLNRRMSKSC